ncbi:hypothetical protein [Corynebacterium flavescens]|uniref:hypothetical protein n=1 Tax=Corynebacterium flavescens TaxID=28028 RepID=UPI00289C133E|nr:hypothetical protein [Corynebacterium flavescens]
MNSSIGEAWDGSVEFGQGDQEWVEKLGEYVFPAIRELQKQVLKPPDPEDGSSLAADDFGGIDVGGAIWYSMCISIEYLSFIADVIEKMQTVPPTVLMTVARSALVTAANAHWMVFGRNRSERRLNVLKYKAEGLKQELSALNDILEVDALTKATKSEQSKDINSKLDWLQEQADNSSIEFCSRARRMMIQTEIIKGVVKGAFPEGQTEYAYLRFAVLRVWRSGSSAAHGLSQFAAGRFVMEESENPGSKSMTGRMYADIENDIGPAIFSVFLVLDRAWRQYHLRRVKHL